MEGFNVEERIPKNIEVPDEIFDRGVRIFIEMVLKEEKERQGTNNRNEERKQER